MDNTDYQSHEEQETAIDSYFDWRNGGHSISIQTWRSYKRHLEKAG